MFSTSFTLHEEKKHGTFNMASLYVDRKGVVPINKDLSKTPTQVTEYFARNVDKILNFEGRDDDTYVVTMPKCGTTWMLEAVWLILNDFDFDKASKTVVLEKAPYLEFNLSSENLANKMNTLKMLQEMESPRLIKSHLPARVLPTDLWKNKSKVIYVTRNAEDVLVSGYHYFTDIGILSCTFEEYAESFLNNEMFFQPFWAHVSEFWEMRDQPNIYFTSYERMTEDLRSIIKELCEFLGKLEPSEEVLDEAESHLNFDNMKNSNAGKKFRDMVLSNNNVFHKQNQEFQFFRKGKIGSFKDELSEKLIKKLTYWTELNKRNYGIYSDEMYSA